MRLFTGLQLGVLGMAASLAAHAIGPAAARAQDVRESRPETALNGQVELARLVDLASQRLGINIDYDAAALKGSATLRLATPLTDQELWALTNRVLAARGLTTIRVPGAAAYSVVRLADAANLTGPAPAGETAGALPGFRAVVLRAEHKPAKGLIEAVSRVLSKPGGAAVAIGDDGLVLISDLSSRLDQALALFRTLDVPGTPCIVEEVRVEHLPAARVATLVAQVSSKRDAAAGEKVPGEVIPGPDAATLLVIAPQDRVPYWRALALSLDKREPVLTETYTPRGASIKELARVVEETVRDASGTGADERWRLVTNEATGTLIATATPSQHEQIKSLIDRLDASPASSQRQLRSFNVRNRPVRELQATLTQMLSAGALAESPAADSAPPGPSEPSTARQLTHDPTQPRGIPASPAPIQFTSDEGTNTLIAMGEPRAVAQIEGLLASLDVRQPQVMLEVLIVSLSDSQTLDLGVELDKQTSIGETKVRLSSLFGLGFRGAGGDRTVGDGSGFTGLVLSPGDFSIVLRALQTINHGRSLSMPRLLVANNQQGVLDSVLTQPYASTNASTTVATTSFGGSQDAGTQVTLKPQIATGDHLNLDYSISLSAFVGAPPSPNLPPPRQQNKVQSAASLPDGYTVAVGGIELTGDGQGASQVPVLGDIPILGEAFKNRSKNRSRSRFYVFIRANVLRNQSYEDLKYLSGVAAGQAGVDDGFPVVEPRMIR